MPADSATHTFEFAAIAFAGPLPLMDPNMGPRWREMAMRGGGRTSGGQAGIVTWLHAAQEMGESILTVHPPRPLMTTDIGLPRIFSSPRIVTRLHAAQEMGESALAVHLPRPLTTTDIGLPL